MFTGIVQTLGKVLSITPTKHGRQLSIAIPKNAKRIAPGSSVSINGACLTVTRVRKKNFSFDIVPETLRKTNLGVLQPGDKVNIEPSLHVGDELGGHFVLGHVDGVGVVTGAEDVLSFSRKRESRNNKQKEYTLTVRVPQSLVPFIAPKGCIAVDGVSLTVVKVANKTLTVALIPYTLSHTTLGERKIGDKVNIEVDLIARYLEKLI